MLIFRDFDRSHTVNQNEECPFRVCVPLDVVFMLVFSERSFHVFLVSSRDVANHKCHHDVIRCIMPTFLRKFQ